MEGDYMPAPVKKNRRRKAGLLHSFEKVEIQDVKNAHKKGCSRCFEKYGGIIPPQGRRLVIRRGSGRHQQLVVLCEQHGHDWLQARASDVERAKAYLIGAIDAIRGDDYVQPKPIPSRKDEEVDEDDDAE
jgi:hypothetical protein